MRNWKSLYKSDCVAVDSHLFPVIVSTLKALNPLGRHNTFTAYPPWDYISFRWWQYRKGVREGINRPRK